VVAGYTGNVVDWLALRTAITKGNPVVVVVKLKDYLVDAPIVCDRLTLRVGVRALFEGIPVANVYSSNLLAKIGEFSPSAPIKMLNDARSAPVVIEKMVARDLTGHSILHGPSADNIVATVQ
jgi:hypothetical protein